MLSRSRLAERFIGDKAFYREVAAVALPIILQQLILTAMGFVDGVMVGQIDASSMASVMVANKYFTNLQCILFGVNGAAGIFISQYYGADDHDKGQGLFAFNIIGSITVAALFFALIAIFPQEILSIFVSDPGTIRDGEAYLQFVRFSYLPYAITQAIMTSLRSIGHTRKPLLISSSAVFINSALNYLLIFGNFGLPKMGVAGAGLATLIARIIEMALYLALLAPGNQYFTLALKPIRTLGRTIIQAVVRKTIPLVTNEFLWSSGQTLLFLAYCKIDENNIASLTIIESVGNIVFVLLHGIGVAVSVLVGTRLGSSRFAEARQNVRRLTVLSMTVAFGVGIIVFALAGQIPQIFNISDSLRNLTTQMLRIQAVFYTMLIYNITMFFVMRIGGDMKATLVIDSGFIWFFVLPLALLLSQVIRPGMLIFYLIIQSAEMLKMVIATHYYRKGRWLCNLT